jgi:hypothetical protein
MEPMYLVVFAFVIGLILAGGIFALRRFAWDAAVMAGYLSLACLGLLAIAGVVFLVGAGSKGSDGTMIVAIAAVYGGAALMLVALMATLGAYGVRHALSRPIGASFVTAVIDPVVLGLLVWWFLGSAMPFQYRAQADAWQRREQDWRRQIERLSADIPEPYRSMPPEMIAQHKGVQAQLEGQGMPQSPLAPPELEAKVVELARLRQSPPSASNMGGLHKLGEVRRAGLFGLGIGWTAGLFAGLLIFRVRRLPVRAD